MKAFMDAATFPDAFGPTMLSVRITKKMRAEVLRNKL